MLENIGITVYKVTKFEGTVSLKMVLIGIFCHFYLSAKSILAPDSYWIYCVAGHSRQHMKTKEESFKKGKQVRLSKLYKIITPVNCLKQPDTYKILKEIQYCPCQEILHKILADLRKSVYKHYKYPWLVLMRVQIIDGLA